ncbi:MAG TPA: hypothetical protein VFG00_02180, partial [Acidothermaceae bacterium]|nr:hypothetical protein [Acidothermaceae bacterium]
HGVTAGTDTPRLRMFYLLTGLVVVAVATTRTLGHAAMHRTPPAADGPQRHDATSLHSAGSSRSSL